MIGGGAITLPRQGAPGALLLHGTGDTPQVLAELAAHLHTRGFAVHAPLLASHGRQLSALGTANARVWYADADRALSEMRQAHDWVGVVGLSMGGSLAIQLAAVHHDIPALVLLAPYVAMPRLIERAAATSASWGWLLPYFSAFGSRSIHDTSAATRSLGHGVLTPAILRALRQVVLATTDALPQVRSPTRVIQSREDNRISASSATEAFARLGAEDKEFVWVEGAGHVITVDHGRERVFELTSEWLESNRGARGTRAPL
jgi:carboxylesterase